MAGRGGPVRRPHPVRRQPERRLDRDWVEVKGWGGYSVSLAAREPAGVHGGKDTELSILGPRGGVVATVVLPPGAARQVAGELALILTGRFLHVGDGP